MLPSLSRFNILGHVFGLLGRVRFRISANPFLESGRFLQTLRLRDATVEFRLGEGEDMVSARVWVDAHHPVIHVLVEGGRPLEVNASVETWWDCRNPMPEIAGLLAVTERLRALAGDKVEAGEKALWERLHMKMPDIPIQEVEGRKRLAPAEKFATKSNIENPELYAVFPYRRVALGRPGIELAVEALNHRLDRGNFGWRQEDIFMAYLGLTGQARDYVVGRARAKNEGSRSRPSGDRTTIGSPIRIMEGSCSKRSRRC